jgi:hypothetical protein
MCETCVEHYSTVPNTAGECCWCGNAVADDQTACEVCKETMAEPPVTTEEFERYLATLPVDEFLERMA